MKFEFEIKQNLPTCPLAVVGNHDNCWIDINIKQTVAELLFMDNIRLILLKSALLTKCNNSRFSLCSLLETPIYNWK